jgi:hypothetical protein
MDDDVRASVTDSFCALFVKQMLHFSSAIQVMKEESSPEFAAKFWESRSPNHLPKRLVVAQEGGRPLDHSIKTSALDLDLGNQARARSKGGLTKFQQTLKRQLCPTAPAPLIQ